MDFTNAVFTWAESNYDMEENLTLYGWVSTYNPYTKTYTWTDKEHLNDLWNTGPNKFSTGTHEFGESLIYRYKGDMEAILAFLKTIE